MRLYFAGRIAVSMPIVDADEIERAQQNEYVRAVPKDEHLCIKRGHPDP
jgi:hypothetical protein